MLQPAAPVTDTVEFDFRHIRDALDQRYEGPFLILESRLLQAKVQTFRTAMPRVHPHFAVKSNPNPRVLEVLRAAGAGFEIASPNELDTLLQLNVPASEIFYSNPIKSRENLTYALERGVEWFVLDAVEELHKIFELAPDANLFLRLFTSNEGSAYPLSGKFGAHEQEAAQIISEAARLGADLAGTSFHVGCQCSNVENWRTGLRASRDAFEHMKSVGLAPRLLNLGGGYPIDMGHPVPSIWEIGTAINEELDDFPPEVRVIAEPGRYLVGDAGWFVCRVVGTSTRKGQRWVYLDAGTHGGLTELTDDFALTVRTDRTGPMISWTVAGPTCDGSDVCVRDQLLPVDLQEGDFVYVEKAGAYTNALASTFNGFPPPAVIVV
jgi:ornithine decarboxylase